MNTVEKALMHGLFVHLHHNIDKAIDFGQLEELNKKVSQMWPGALLVGPQDNDDAAVFKFPEMEGLFVAKMESHCSPGVPRPYDAAATGAGGAMRDVVAMGARPLFLLDFIGTRPLDQEVLVGPCGFKGVCDCGECKAMTSAERLNLIVKGVKDMCDAMDVFVVGGGLSTSFSDIVPAIVVAVVGKLVTEKPLTKPAKKAGHRLIVVGETGRDGNDTLYRAGLVDEMRPAKALFSEERRVMDATIEAFKTGKIKACSDLGAAGIGAAVSESARFGGFGAEIDLTNVPVMSPDITPEEILICETQGRMLLHVEPGDVDDILQLLRGKGVSAEVIGKITDGDKEIFKYEGTIIAEIPNKPTPEMIKELNS